MANFYDSGIFGIANNSIDFVGDTIKVILLDTNHTFDSNNQTVDQITANELDTGNPRKEVTSKEVTLDSNNGLITLTANVVSYTGLNIGTINSAVFFKEVNDDTDSVLLMDFQLSQPFTTDGGDFELSPSLSNGFMQIVNSIS